MDELVNSSVIQTLFFVRGGGKERMGVRRGPVHAYMHDDEHEITQRLHINNGERRTTKLVTLKPITSEHYVTTGTALPADHTVGEGGVCDWKD